MMELGADNPEKALEVVENVKRLNPDSLSPLALEADILSRIGRDAEAFTIYSNVFEQQPSSLGALNVYRTGVSANVENPHIVLEHWVEDNPNDAASTMVLAQHLDSHGEDIEAVQMYEAAIAADSDNIIALNNLAWLYNEQGNPKAEELARRAHELLPDSGSIMDTLGWILVTNGKNAEGIQILTEAVSKSPDSKAAYYHLAVASNNLGDSARSVAILKSLLADEAHFAERDGAEALLAELE